MPRLAFGPFEFDSISGRLWKYGHVIKLQPKSAGILEAVLEKPGEVVSRDRIQTKLWPDGTFVDFDRSINVAAKRLRDALSDSTDEPKYIATVPGQGYRFIAPVVSVTAPEPPPKIADELHPVIPATATEVPAARGSASRGRLAVAACLAIAAMFAGGWIIARPRISFQRHDYVLITDFDNRTGDPMVDGAVETVLRRELSNSPFVSVVPPSRVEDTLRLMRKPLSARIDAQTGREVCLRDGGIAAMLTGRVQKLGSAYDISIFLVNPADGRTVAAFNDTADGEKQLVDGIRRVTNAVRRRLGEDAGTIQSSGEKLERVTTPSLEALKLYSQGEHLGEDSRWREAEQLFRRAVARDPQFASANCMLAWSLKKQYSSDPKMAAETEALLERANAMADSVTDREANFIRGSYYEIVSGDTGKAIAAFQAVLDVYPDDYWSANNVVNLQLKQENEQAAAVSIRRITRSRPNDPHLYTDAWLFAATHGIKVDADGYLERLRFFDTAGLLSPSDKAVLAWQPAFERAGAGDVEHAIRDAEAVMARAKAGQIDLQTATFFAQFFFPAVGKFAEAEKIVREGIRNEIPQEQALEAIEARAGGDGQRLVEVTERIRRERPDFVPAAIFALGDLAHVGRFAEARAAEQRVPAGRRFNGELDWMFKCGDADLKRGEGKLDEAIPVLQECVKHWQVAGFRGAVFFASDGLARALDAKGDLAGAIAVLEPLERDPSFDPSQGSAPTEQRFLLSVLYRKAGRIADARKVETELLDLLRFADPDYPILVKLRQITPSSFHANHNLSPAPLR